MNFDQAYPDTNDSGVQSNHTMQISVALKLRAF